MKISLCCITGNAEQYVGRFLDSFQPHFDEVVLVRAIGNQMPDRTIEIAEARGCVTGEYFNDEERQDWPHVDDFAAARNAAFDMATGDWVMWADMDDLLEGGENIRDNVSRIPEGVEVLSVPYDVRDDQLRIQRERIIRRGVVRWTNPIHEEMRFPDGTQVAETNDFQVVHLPLGKRTANDERNVRILESIPEPNASQRFHLAQSLRACGRVEEGKEVASRLLIDAPEDLGKVEKFELFLYLAQLAGSLEERTSLTLQALAADPRRREGYGELALAYLAAGESEEAESWARAMSAQPMPDRPAWNLRRKFYGYLEPQILGMTLRRQGRVEEADAIETNHVVRHGAKISLLHATRGRPDMAAKTRRRWLEAAADPDSIEHIYGLDADDTTAAALASQRYELLAGKGGPVAAWNACAEASVGEVLVQLSDDWEPVLHWDKLILDALGDTSEPKVLAVSDGHRTDDLLCMAICTRKRWQDQGHLFHPDFFSMYSDNWFSERAFADGVVVDARDRIQFTHLHPAFGAGEMDATYARSNAGINYGMGAATLEILREAGADYSQEGQQRLIEAYFRMLGTGKGRYLDVGAFDGKTFSNTLRLEEMGWEGICLEPHPESFAKLQARRKAICVQSAAAERHGEATLTYPDVEGEAWHGHALATTGGCERANVPVKRVQVPCGPVQDSIPADWGKIDLVSIDCEGADLTALLTLDLEKHRPDLIVIEAASGRQAVWEHLRRHDYALLRSGGQDLYFIPNPKNDGSKEKDDEARACAEA